MSKYHLYLRSYPDGTTETMQVDGDNIVRALDLARSSGFRGLAELWCDGRRLCNIEYSAEDDYWAIVPPVRARARVADGTN